MSRAKTSPGIPMNRSIIARTALTVTSLGGVTAVTLLGTASAQTAPAAPPAFAQCAVCHATTANGPKKIGPTLAGVAGKPAATRPGYVYSAALKGKRIVWTDANLNQFLSGPAKMVPGTKMSSAGVSNAANRAAIIAYLKTLR
jgi:cytochrome c